MKRIAFPLLLAVSFAPAHAATLKEGIACVSWDLLNQATTAAISDDTRGFNYLMSHGGTITKPGIEISVLETFKGDFSSDTYRPSVVKVRAYIGDEAIILWTGPKNIEVVVVNAPQETVKAEDFANPSLLPLRTRYITDIQNKVERNWIKPPSATPGLSCKVAVKQIPGGEVINVRVTQCAGDEIFQ
jgi:hypothetical protein